MADTTSTARDRMIARVKSLPTPLLVSSLAMADAQLKKAKPGSDDARALLMTRVWLIEEVEHRFPEALAAVEAECDRVADDEDLDYVAVLLTAVPA